MKRVVWLLLALVCILTSVNSCTFIVNTGNNNVNTQESHEQKDDAIESDTPVYEIYPVALGDIAVTSMTDGKNNYFYVKLGEIHNVPVYTNAAHHHDGRTDVVYKWESSYVTEEGFKNTISNCINVATNATTKAYVNTGVEAGLKAGYASVSAKVNAGMETTLGSSYSQSSTVSATESINQKISNSQSQMITISKDSPKGYYQYAVYGDFYMYTEIVCDIAARKVTYSYYSVPIPNSYVSGLWYSKDGAYDIAPNSHLALTEEIFKKINLFDENIDTKTEDCIYGECEFVDTEKIKIVDDGAFGLEHPDLIDCIDLSQLSDYMTNEYEFSFNGECKYVSEKKSGFWNDGWVDGYHEIFLYNQLNERIGNSEDLAASIVQKKYGLLDSCTWTENEGGQPINWIVSGEKCRQYMYLYYDAYGEGEDTWYCKSIIITISVRKK